ncbi:MAG: hypothetical protein NDF54_01545 [archaeon GB-1867-035]|nr:hypothetical protein [Candidatus Culexmicrobium profundum]
MAWYKRIEIPILITAICALIQILPYYFTLGPVAEDFQSNFVNWQMVVGTGALLVGAIAILQLHIPRIMQRRPQWEYSLALLLTFIIMVIFGLPIKEVGLGLTNPVFEFLYGNILTPLSSTMYSILGFFIASAAYRAFRARTLEATVLLLAGSLLMLKNAPIGTAFWPGFGTIGDWLFNIPNMSTQRAIYIGGALGAIVLGVRTIAGYEKGYLRGGGE